MIRSFDTTVLIPNTERKNPWDNKWSNDQAPSTGHHESRNGDAS